ncbi:MAG: hypothetical protein OXT69_08010 [Candidatus Poribacteria bacterium]|nr:hypothetical protein [Candidatus Poribacteria bacterium]
MQRLRNMTARRALLLAGVAAALTLLIVGGIVLLNEGEQPPAQDETAAVQDGTADRTEESPTDRKSVLKPKKEPDAPQTLENGKLVPDGYKWRDSHPWLVSVRGERYRRYIGPQTAEAIFAVYDSPYATGEKAEKLLAHWKLVLARGAVVNDYRDALEYGFSLMNTLERLRNGDADLSFYRKFHSLSADASVEEIEAAEIARNIRLWPIKKEQYNHAAKTGEGTLNVTLFPDDYGSGAIGISTVRAGGSRGSRNLTDEEMYNITRHGVAPKGFRLRFVDENDNEIPFDRVPFFNERDAVKHMNKADLEQLLVAIPSYLSHPDAQEQSTVAWMQMVDRYDAALAELADRGQVPMPAAVSGEPGAAKPLGPMVEWGDPDPRRIQRAEPPGLREAPDIKAVKAQEKARVAEAERRIRVAEAYVSALEKQAEKANISETARSQISRRVQELRALMLGPAGPPVEPPPSQDSGEDEEE